MNILEEYDIQSDGVDCWTWTCMSKKPVHPKDVTRLVKSVEFVLHKCDTAFSGSKQRMTYNCEHCQDFQISFFRDKASANKDDPFYLDEKKIQFQNHSVDCLCYAYQKKNECARLPSAMVLKNHPLFLEFVKHQLYGKRETGNQQSRWKDAIKYFESHQINMNSIKRKPFFNVFNEIKEKLIKAKKQPNDSEDTEKEESLSQQQPSSSRASDPLAKLSQDDILVVYPFGAEKSQLEQTVESLSELSEFGHGELVETSSEERSEESEDDPGKKRGRTHNLTVRVVDYNRLKPGEYLNDTLIDLFMQWMIRNDDRTNTHIFSTHFFTTLVEEGTDAVTKWTKNKGIDIFTRKFIFIPINKSLHWSLCVVVEPGLICQQEGESAQGSPFPCLIFLDSLKARQKAHVRKNVHAWLNSEWERLGKDQENESPFTTKTMPIYSPIRIPKQKNSWDCGVFVCRYAYAVYTLRTCTFSKDYVAKLSDLDVFQFGMPDIARIRNEMSTWILRLHEVYKVWKKENQESESGSSQESDESSTVEVVEKAPKKRKNMRRFSRRTKSKTKSSETPLEPFDEVPPDPVIPPGTKGEWSFDPETRVLLADFRNVEVISADLKLVLLEFMERDDISLVSWGLIHSIDVASGNILDYLLMAFHGGTPYHKFRRFDRVQKEDVTYFEENETFITMLVRDFCKYMKLRLEGSKEPFDFVDNETQQAIHFDNVDDVALYMIDVEMPKFTPDLCDWYMKSFKAEEILPGGEFCMMNAVSPSARPFMGPNLYLTCGGFTSFHQDGHGTVDSGHTCLSGYNEVVMLRRLPEQHKLNAMMFLPKGEPAMYRLPHESRKTDLQIWPRNSTIDEWRAMNYAPSVFILGPGQHLHINKGRLHCFRKLTPDPLASTDCHNILRNELLSELRSKSLMSASTFMCLSIAYDWMFLGVSAEGIQREVESCLECGERCRTRPIPLKYLAIPETCVTKMASRMLPSGQSFLPELLWDSNTVRPQEANVRRGILPSLRRLVERESTLQSTLPILSPPDAHESAEKSPIDPYGSDFMCHICHGELSNVYLHCMGCENLLSKDFNICTHCHQSGRFHMKVMMHPVDKRSLTDVNHIGSEDRKDQRGGCSCRQGTCKKCGYCRGCSCRCHHEFQQRRRFFTNDQLVEVLDCVESLSGEAIL